MCNTFLLFNPGECLHYTSTGHGRLPPLTLVAIQLVLQQYIIHRIGVVEQFDLRLVRGVGHDTSNQLQTGRHPRPGGEQCQVVHRVRAVLEAAARALHLHRVTWRGHGHVTPGADPGAATRACAPKDVIFNSLNP